ncbi:hypothetical protein Ciccas_000708 [Cichlidogyrus casuarinus]|uniref:Uncharacterized protein n=1 Tax=Cichlidogyrus casuarinus TaxID=1844966 RepID=A0ABD2QMD3_9PLAT
MSDCAEIAKSSLLKLGDYINDNKQDEIETALTSLYSAIHYVPQNIRTIYLKDIFDSVGGIKHLLDGISTRDSFEEIREKLLHFLRMLHESPEISTDVEPYRANMAVIFLEAFFCSTKASNREFALLQYQAIDGKNVLALTTSRDHDYATRMAKKLHSCAIASTPVSVFSSILSTLTSIACHYPSDVDLVKIHRLLLKTLEKEYHNGPHKKVGACIHGLTKLFLNFTQFENDPSFLQTFEMVSQILARDISSSDYSPWKSSCYFLSECGHHILPKKRKFSQLFRHVWTLADNHTMVNFAKSASLSICRSLNKCLLLEPEDCALKEQLGEIFAMLGSDLCQYLTTNIESPSIIRTLRSVSLLLPTLMVVLGQTEVLKLVSDLLRACRNLRQSDKPELLLVGSQILVSLNNGRESRDWFSLLDGYSQLLDDLFIELFSVYPLHSLVHRQTEKKALTDCLIILHQNGSSSNSTFAQLVNKAVLACCLRPTETSQSPLVECASSFNEMDFTTDEPKAPTSLDFISLWTYMIDHEEPSLGDHIMQCIFDLPQRLNLSDAEDLNVLQNFVDCFGGLLRSRQKLLTSLGELLLVRFVSLYCDRPDLTFLLQMTQVILPLVHSAENDLLEKFAALLKSRLQSEERIGETPQLMGAFLVLPKEICLRCLTASEWEWFVKAFDRFAASLVSTDLDLIRHTALLFEERELCALIPRLTCALVKLLERPLTQEQVTIETSIMRRKLISAEFSDVHSQGDENQLKLRLFQLMAKHQTSRENNFSDGRNNIIKINCSIDLSFGDLCLPFHILGPAIFDRLLTLCESVKSTNDPQSAYSAAEYIKHATMCFLFQYDPTKLDELVNLFEECLILASHHEKFLLQHCTGHQLAYKARNFFYSIHGKSDENNLVKASALLTEFVRAFAQPAQEEIVLISANLCKILGNYKLVDRDLELGDLKAILYQALMPIKIEPETAKCQLLFFNNVFIEGIFKLDPMYTKSLAFDALKFHLSSIQQISLENKSNFLKNVEEILNLYVDSPPPIKKLPFGDEEFVQFLISSLRNKDSELIGIILDGLKQLVEEKASLLDLFVESNFHDPLVAAWLLRYHHNRLDDAIMKSSSDLLSQAFLDRPQQISWALILLDLSPQNRLQIVQTLFKNVQLYTLLEIKNLVDKIELSDFDSDQIIPQNCFTKM